MRRPDEILVCSGPDGLDDVFAKFERGPLAVDTETTGLRWAKGDRVGSINLAAGRTAAFFHKGALGRAALYLSRQVKRERELVFHNAKFDMHMMRETFHLNITYPVHDTAVQSFLLDNRGVAAYGNFSDNPHSLKPLASIFVDPTAQDPEKQMMAAIRKRVGRGATKGDWMALIGTEDERLVTEYSALDPWYTLQLYRQFIARIDGWRQPREVTHTLRSLYETERWMILAFRDMEARGIQVHKEYLEKWRVELGGLDGQGGKLGELRQKLAKLAGREINWNSSPQLGQLLYGSKGEKGLNLPITRWTTPKDNTKEAKPSTDEVALRTLAHPIGDVLSEYRETYKQWSSYAEGLLEAVCADSAIRCTFKSTGARTGRTSCVEPNLQQQTRESGVRRAYHPRKGLQFRFADYSQVEMRFAAHFANEPTLIKGFNYDDDFDTHRATAQVMYGITEPSERQRKFGKILNFTTLFGGGVKKVAEQLQERLGIIEVKQALRELHYRCKPGELPHLALATLLKERFNHAMPGMRTATREEGDLAEQREFVMNAFGRHRYIEFNKWYSAFNSKVQGTAGDQAKRGLVAVYRERQLREGDLALLLLIHDELVYETEGDPRTDRAVLELMRDTTSFKVPIIADMKAGIYNWQEKSKVDLTKKKKRVA